jgi:hypothetical protein
MTSKHGARAIHYEFLQLYRFSTCTMIIPMDPIHLILPQGIYFIPTPHPTLQVFNLNSQTYMSEAYLRVELPPHENVREYHYYQIDF